MYQTVTQLLKKEVDKGYVIGPFQSSPFPVFRTCPIGVATRKYSGKKRLIFNISTPCSGPFSTVNSLIPLEPYSLHYATVDNAIKLIKLAGQGAWLSQASFPSTRLSRISSVSGGTQNITLQCASNSDAEVAHPYLIRFPRHFVGFCYESESPSSSVCWMISS